MAKEIRWSVRADRDRLEILEYWANRNKSTTYSKKLNKLFIDKVELLSEFPDLGKPTNIPFVRIKIVRDYSIYYHINSDFIEILTVWDNRRNPQKLKL
ncbi:MAG: type II toxin-antitoxin system RelE/ParE family toxin [Bacteroidota bacterium]|nr:type II toxin-antitoxin system RelE/ParE family toxin [Bacteroidota bacterium]